MVDLAAFADTARVAMDDHGLDDWSFGWDRAVRRNGQCDLRSMTITMSKHLTSVATDDEAMQTLLHEIAHALVGPGHGHDRVWLAMARAIGYRGQRCSSRAEYDKVAAAAPYVDECPNGHTSPRWRKRSSTARATSCGRCSPVFDRRYLITTRPNVNPHEA